MPPKVILFEEPKIEFRYGQQLEDPHDGLSLFGPFDSDLQGPKSIRYGVIGTDYGIRLLEEWSRAMNRPIIQANDNKKLWPPFPGFDVAFNCMWPEKPSWSFSLNEKDLICASHNRNPYDRAFEIVNMYMEGFKVIEKKDETYNVIVCIVPDEIYKNCRPKSQPLEPWGDKPRNKVIQQYQRGQKTLFEQWNDDNPEGWTTDKYDLSVDFRRQIKARALKYNIPIQIILESTLTLNDQSEDRRSLTCLSDRAWNLSTALYYKSGGKPWKLATAREGVCYIGISFRKTGSGNDDKTACCAAQMFLNSGDGVVFLGDEGPWYSPEKKQFHLSKEAASKLLSGILKTYSQLEGKALNELFIHSRSPIRQDEFEGYRSACPQGVKIVGVHVRRYRNDKKLYRAGKMPVLRGTFLKWSNKIGYLWGTGFKPRIETYDGWEVPNPLKIEIQYGDADIEQVALDIFGLTKLNYNACRLGDSEPVTIMFSDDVGEILISNPKITERRPQFKFYI